MAVAKLEFLSESLGFNTYVNVLLPDNTIDEKTSVLYLLHGLSDNCNAWLYRSSIQRYVENKNIAVVMPEVQKSFYVDMAYGDDYYTYIAKELPEIMSKYFTFGKSFIAGLSMGGYGALKVALCNPKKYEAVGSFSGVVDMVSYVNDRKDQRGNHLQSLFGTDMNVKNTDNDLFYLVKKLKGNTPPIYLSCGIEDFLYRYNQSFKEICMNNNVDIKYYEQPAVHSWDFWDGQIQMFLDFINI